jgi:hypothetical protein
MSSVVDVDSTPPANNSRRIRLYALIAALLVVVVILGIAGISKLGGTSRAQKGSPTAIAAAAELATATPTIVQPTEAPTRKPTNTPVVASKETDTPVKATIAPVQATSASTSAPTIAPTKLAAAIVVTPTPKPTEIPNTGLGSSGIVIGALLLVVLIFLARRLRVVSES